MKYENQSACEEADGRWTDTLLDDARKWLVERYLAHRAQSQARRQQLEQDINSGKIKLTVGEIPTGRRAAARAFRATLGPLSKELGISIANLKHIKKHLSEFTARDAALGLKEVVRIGKDVLKNGIDVKRNAREKIVIIGGNPVLVRAARDLKGFLKTVYI